MKTLLSVTLFLHIPFHKIMTIIVEKKSLRNISIFAYIFCTVYLLFQMLNVSLRNMNSYKNFTHAN